MFTEDQILDIIKQKIETDEKLGEQTGGSGHKGYVSYQIKNFKSKQILLDKLEITYSYVIYVETEFTYYPDNPPMEYNHTKTIMVNRNKEIIDEGKQGINDLK